MSNFIPSFHYTPASEKMTDKWCQEVVDWCYYNKQMLSLLHNKNIEEIEGFSDGTFDLDFARKITSSQRQAIKAANGRKVSKREFDMIDKSGVPYDQINLITPLLNTAISVIDQRPMEITFKCQDPLAFRKKQEDLDLLRNNPKIKETMQPIYDEFEIGDFEMFKTKHSSVPYTVLPFGLNSDNEEEFNYFANFILNISAEAALESIAQQTYENNKIGQVKYLELKDLNKWGICANSVYNDDIVGLPNVNYVYPDSVCTTRCIMPDYSDRTEEYIKQEVTIEQIFQRFGSEIGSMEELDKMVKVYNTSNNRNIYRDGYKKEKVQLLCFAVKTIDYIGIGEKTTQYGNFKYFTSTPNKIKTKLWAQNTVRFYWLPGTDKFFNKEVLGFAYRDKGNPTYTCFPTNIYKCSEKSPVENAIIEAKTVQIATIKLLHALIIATPQGKAINWSGVQNFLDNIKDERNEFTMQDALEFIQERNIVLYDTKGFEGQKMQNYTSVTDIAGGIKDSLNGFFVVINNAKQNMKIHFGLNDSIMGQNNNPDALIGVEKIRINMATNSQSHIVKGINSQYQNVFNILTYYFKKSIEDGGAAREAMVSMIGNNKVDLIDSLSDVSKHNPIPKIQLGLMVEERELFKMELQRLRQSGVLNAAEEYFIFNMINTKDAVLLISMKEERFKREQKEAAQASNQALLQREQIVGQNMMQNQQAQAAAKEKQIQMQLAGQAQIQSIIQKMTADKEVQSAMIKRYSRKEQIFDSHQAKMEQLEKKDTLEKTQSLI